MKSLLVLSLCLTATCVHAEFYGVLGFGKAILKEDATDNNWHQTGFDHIAATQTNTWKIGLGYRLTRNFAVELDYRDLGEFNQHALYTADAPVGAPGTYNAQMKSCVGQCAPTASSFNHGYTKGVGLSLVAAPNWQYAVPFVRGGVFYHYSNFYSSQVYSSDPQQKTLAIYHSNAEAPNNDSFRSAGFGVLYGFGVRAGPFELEYDTYPKVQSWVSPWRDANTLTLGYRVKF